MRICCAKPSGTSLPSLMFLPVFLHLAGVPLSPSPLLSWDLPAIEMEELRYYWERQLGGDANPMRTETSVSTWKILEEKVLNETFSQNKYVKEIGGEERPFSRNMISADNLHAATGIVADLGEGQEIKEQGILGGISECKSPCRDECFG